MSLNITVLSPRVIYQSGDFRLADRRGRRLDFETQKQLLINRFRWSAVVAFAGVGSVGGLVVSDWLAARTAELPQDADFDALIDVLLRADDWLQHLRLPDRLHTFSVGSFVGSRPLFTVVSNFESVHARPSRLPRPRLHVSYLRPRRERAVVTGRPGAVLRTELQSLIGLLRADAAPDVVMDTLAEVNAAASARDETFISRACFTSFVRLTGEGGAKVHGQVSGRIHTVDFALSPEMNEAIESLLREHFPQGSQVRSVSTVRAEATESYHRLQLREKPSDPNVHSNFGAYLKDVVKDDAEAEKAYIRALELDPEHSNALGNYANLLWDRGELDRAEDQYRRALLSNPQNHIARLNFGRFLVRARDDVQVALQTCEEGLNSESENADLLALYCELLIRRGEYEEASQHYARLYSLRPSSAEVALGYGTALDATGAHPTTVEPLYRQVLAQEPEHGTAMVNLAQIRYRQGGEEEAVSLVHRALALDIPAGVKAEALFCWYAIDRNREVLVELKKLLSDGARSYGWNLTPVVDWSVAAAHLEAEFLRVLGEVVTGLRNLEELDAFPVWRDVVS